MASINFLYRSTKPNANLVLRLLFRNNGIDYVFGAKTKLLIGKDYWNNQHSSQRVKDIEISNKQVEVNAKLNKIENHVLNALNEINIDLVTKEWLQTQIDYYYTPPTEAISLPNRLIDYIDYFITEKKDENATSTIAKYRTIKKKLKELEGILKKEILISDIDNKFKTEFVNYYKQIGYAINTRQREFKAIKTICRHARNNNLETSIQLDGLRLATEKTAKIYLTIDEIETIENTEFKSEAIRNAKDWLIISCYCGQRVSDFLRFTKEMIRTEGELTLIDFEQKKTGKLMELPLHPKILQILNKNNGNFPYKLSDQRYNDHIKDVCKEANITHEVRGSKMNKETYRKESGLYPKYELVSSHIGRRSFATNNYGKIPTAYLISITGHSTEAMFLEYIGKAQNEQAKGIVKYW